ncbi:hypothetical protein K1W69_14530 [Hoeflea sp. WL0058]|uniref:Uncharacterized protein n=1 Tax=Flavimaribacter sediminis TaxID=2865987 RepID=A0AAE2ZPD8_9HYPH|nr:hypothetical protein [Flavimaribacter sediminis]MBW8638410.1 hypothetical protein [Flavimaribacter sediminis]
MKRAIKVAVIACVAAVSITSAYAYKSHCEWNITSFNVEGGRNIAVSYFEHPHQPEAVKTYVKTLRDAGMTVITQKDLVRGVRIPPIADGKSLVIVFEEMPRDIVNSHFPSPDTDMHIVQIDKRATDSLVNSVKANYTSRELAAHPIKDEQVDVYVDAYLAHYRQLKKQ